MSWYYLSNCKFVNMWQFGGESLMNKDLLVRKKLFSNFGAQLCGAPIPFSITCKWDSHIYLILMYVPLWHSVTVSQEHINFHCLEVLHNNFNDITYKCKNKNLVGTHWSLTPPARVVNTLSLCINSCILVLGSFTFTERKYIMHVLICTNTDKKELWVRALLYLERRFVVTRVYTIWWGKILSFEKRLRNASRSDFVFQVLEKTPANFNSRRLRFPTDLWMAWFEYP